MTTPGRPIVVGIFKEEMQAKNVVDVLRDAEFSDDQLNIATYKGEMNHHLFADLADIGLPEEEIDYYRREFEVGRSIVLVKHDGRQMEAVSILILYGTRIHEYLNSGRYDGVSTNERWNNQYGSAEGSSFRISSKNSSPLKIEKTAEDEVPVWMRILKDAGFDHLI